MYTSISIAMVPVTVVIACKAFGVSLIHSDNGSPFTNPSAIFAASLILVVVATTRSVLSFADRCLMVCSVALGDAAALKAMRKARRDADQDDNDLLHCLKKYSL